MEPERPDPCLPHLDVLALETLRRLSPGAVHSLHNALTGILGEASFLLAERKTDPEVVESCHAIQEQVERCVRLTRRLAARQPAHGAGPGVCDLVRLARDLEPLLRGTLSASIGLELELPDDLLLVRGAPAELELLIVLIVHRLAELGGPGAALRLACRAQPAGRSELRVAVRAVRLGAQAGERAFQGEGACDPWARLVREATHGIAAGHGAALVGEGGDGFAAVRLDLESVAVDARA